MGMACASGGERSSISMTSELGARARCWVDWGVISYRRFWTMVGGGGGPKGSPRFRRSSAARAISSSSVLPCSTSRKK